MKSLCFSFFFFLFVSKNLRNLTKNIRKISRIYTRKFFSPNFIFFQNMVKLHLENKFTLVLSSTLTLTLIRIEITSFHPRTNLVTDFHWGQYMRAHIGAMCFKGSRLFQMFLLPIFFVMWQSSLGGRFSQIWLQAKYENILLKKFFYVLANPQTST